MVHQIKYISQYDMLYMQTSLIPAKRVSKTFLCYARTKVRFTLRSFAADFCRKRAKNKRICIYMYVTNTDRLKNERRHEKCRKE